MKWNTLFGCKSNRHFYISSFSTSIADLRQLGSILLKPIDLYAHGMRCIVIQGKIRVGFNVWHIDTQLRKSHRYFKMYAEL